MNQIQQETVVNNLPQGTTEDEQFNQSNQENQEIPTLEEIVRILELLANHQN